MLIFRLTGRLFLAAGLIMLLFAGYRAYVQFAFGSTAARAEGVVTDLVRDQRPGFPTRVTVAVVVQFRDAQGVKHQFADPVSSNPPPYDRGQLVPVLYDPAAPETAVIDGFLGRYFVPALFGGLGAILALFGVGFLRVLERVRIRYRERLEQMAART